MKNFLLKTITSGAFTALLLALSAIEGDFAKEALIVCAVSMAWIGLFAYANRDVESW